MTYAELLSALKLLSPSELEQPVHVSNEFAPLDFTLESVSVGGGRIVLVIDEIEQPGGND